MISTKLGKKRILEKGQSIYFRVSVMCNLLLRIVSSHVVNSTSYPPYQLFDLVLGFICKKEKKSAPPPIENLFKDL